MSERWGDQPADRLPLPSSRSAPLSELLDLLPLYAAALAVTLCGIAAVNLAVDDANLASLTVLLASLGFAVSLALRMLRVDPNQAMYPLLGIALFITLQRVLGGEGILDFMVGVRGGNPQPDIVLATLLSWLVVLRSFALLTNYSLLFCAVPTIAMLGLTGSSNPSPEIVFYFFLFLLSTIFMVGYEHHLRLREETTRADRPSLRVHASTALALFVAVAALGGALTLVSRPVLSRLSPYTAPILHKGQSLPTFNTALRNSTGYLPVGSGPINLTETPVLEVRGAGDTELWRTRTYDMYTGRGWKMGQPEDPDFPNHVREDVPFNPPDFGTGLSSDRYFFEYGFKPDAQRRQPVAAKVTKQQIGLLTDVPFWLPLPGRAQSLIGPFGQIAANAAGEVNVLRIMDRGTAYEVTADSSMPSPDQLRTAPPVDRQRFPQQQYLELPLGTERVQELAHRLAAGHRTPYDKAMALQHYIEANCPYTLQEEVTPREIDAVDYYLFTTKEGACDLAGSALAILCRSVDIPARVAVGYLEGVENPATGGRTLREADSHLWVELYFHGYGWVTFNPQPPSGDAATTLPNQVARSARKFWRGLARRGFALFFTVGLTLAFFGAASGPGVGAWWAVLRERRIAAARARRGDPAAVLSLRYRELTDILGRAGWRRAPSETPAAFLQRLRLELPADLAAVLTNAEAVTDAFTRVRYAEETIGAETLTDIAARLQELRRLLGKKRWVASHE